MPTGNTPKRRNYNGFKRKGILDKEDLGITVRDILNLPVVAGARTGKGLEAVRVILRTITEALHRGEEVRIAGFGIFRVATRPPRKQILAIYPGGSATPIGHYLADLPERKYVRFEPSKALLKRINPETTP